MTAEATIFRLPPETMAEIFKHSQPVPHDDCDNQRRRWYSHDDWSWITVSHVCRYWRDIALNTQDLWTYIHIAWRHSNPERIRTYLERSGTSLLHVCYNDNDHECLSLALQHLHRIRKLQILSIPFPSLLLYLISCPAPALKQFTLETDTDQRIDITNFFAEQSPKLTSVSIRTNILTWENIPMMQNLQRLNVCSPINLIDFYNIISQNPTYETLSISTLDNFDHDTGNPLQVKPCFNDMTMSSLQNLNVTDTTYSIFSQLLSSIEFPALRSWNIVCNNFPFEVDDIAIGNPKVIPHDFSRGGHLLRNLSLELVISYRYVRISACSTDKAQDESNLHQSIAYSWETGYNLFGQRISINDVLDFVAAVMEGDFWCSATELTVHVCTASSNGDMEFWMVNNDSIHWRSLLELLPKLRKISVRYIVTSDPATALPDEISSETYLGLLSAIGSHPDDNLDGEPICPELCELHLCRFSLWSADESVRALEPLKDRIKWAKKLSLFRITDALVHDLNKNLHLLIGSEVAETIEVIF